jgi:hypothetical protein
LNRDLKALLQEFSAFSGAFTNIAHNAGYYDSSEAPQLAQDVVDANRNISSLNGKLEKLRSKMAFFAE